MKKIIAASAMAMVLATGAAAEVKVGLGFTVIDGLATSGASFAPANIRVPIDFDFGLRIEPEIALGTDTDTSGPSDLTDTVRMLAVGGYYNLWNVEKVNFYAGGRLALTQFEDERDNGIGGVTTTTSNTTSLQGLFGAEYMFTQDFSFAAQAGLEVNKFEDGTGVGTVSHLLVHYFF